MTMFPRHGAWTPKGARVEFWVAHFQPETLLCGNDADKVGDIAATVLAGHHPGILHAHPEEEWDWNAMLRAFPTPPYAHETNACRQRAATALTPWLRSMLASRSGR